MADNNFNGKKVTTTLISCNKCDKIMFYLELYIFLTCCCHGCRSLKQKTQTGDTGKRFNWSNIRVDHIRQIFVYSCAKRSTERQFQSLS